MVWLIGHNLDYEGAKSLQQVMLRNKLLVLAEVLGQIEAVRLGEYHFPSYNPLLIL